jgi:MFS superfamily sulfate permease-like transporter
MISVPFSLGIVVASGAPPICGLISAIIAGLILPFLGGSFVTISGPAAGLAPALLAGMILLGRGDLKVGYPLLLVAICLTGLVQVVLARLKAARFSSFFPSSVVEGMLASIGLLIIAKQLPLMFGNTFEAHEFWGVVAKLLLEASIQATVVRGRSDGHEPVGRAALRWLNQGIELFRNPVVKRGAVGGTYHLFFGRPLVCFNALHLERELERIPGGISTVALHITDLVTLIDHTTAAALLDFVEDFKRTGRGIAEDYQTVRDLALVNLNPVVLGRHSQAAHWFSLSEWRESEPAAAEGPLAAPVRYM